MKKKIIMGILLLNNRDIWISQCQLGWLMIFPDHHYHDDDNLFGDDDEREDHDRIMLNNEDIWLSTNITMFL